MALVRTAYVTVAPGTGGGVVEVPLITEYCSAWPGTLRAST
jgi:hypothetical protein